MNRPTSPTLTGEPAGLICMRGYSGAGKSTLARKIAVELDGVVLCRDDLRRMMFGSVWTGVELDEVRVTLAEKAMANTLLRRGQHVIIDATHLNPAYLRTWADIAEQHNAEFRIVNVYATLEECLLRNANPGRDQVPPEVIQRQFREWPAHLWPDVRIRSQR